MAPVKAYREMFIGQASTLSRDGLLALAISLYDELEDMRLKQLENERISTETHIQFAELNTKYAAAVAENENLKELLQKEIDKNILKTRSVFGRRTEGFLPILDAADNPEEEPVDESETEDTAETEKRKKEKLKGMTAAERTAARKELVAPKVDALFGCIHSLADSGEIFSDRMKKAIQYALNQEEHLCRFLEDGNIPCDNGHVERVIRSYSIGRANWLFADTVDGAKVNAIMYSIVETAKANHVNVQYYLQYLFEQIPLRRARGDTGFMADMMPWSDACRQYEGMRRQQRQFLFGQLFPVPERPRTPRKHGTPVSQIVVSGTCSQAGRLERIANAV